ncbi:UNVERIFIED_CONTAM: hypothetical protein NCL1_29790 [Trichonephila clavipes]
MSEDISNRSKPMLFFFGSVPDTTEEEPTVSEVSEPGTSDEAAPVVSQGPSPPPVRPDELPVRRLSRRKSDLFPRISAKAAARRHCTAAPSSGVVVDEVTLSKCPWDCARSRSESISFAYVLIRYSRQIIRPFITLQEVSETR